MKPLKPIYTGSSYILNLEYKDQAGSAINITGATAQLVLKKSVQQDPVLSVDGNVTGLSGLIDFEFTPEQTKNLLDNSEKDKDQHVIGAKLILSSGQHIPLFQTNVDVIKSVV